MKMPLGKPTPVHILFILSAASLDYFLSLISIGSQEIMELPCQNAYVVGCQRNFFTMSEFLF